MVLEADRVFLSIGQETDLSFIDSDDVALNERGQLKFDPDLSRTEAQCRALITLPVHQHLSEDQLDYVIECVQSFYHRI